MRWVSRPISCSKFRHISVILASKREKISKTEDNPLMIIRLFILILGLFTFAAHANGPVDCEAFSNYTEKEIKTVMFQKNHKDYMACYYEDPTSAQATRAFGSIYNMVARLDGLPRKFLKKWSKLLHDQTRFVAVDFPLCLGTPCEPDSELVAKNFRKKKLGFVLINRTQWEALDQTARFSLIWHEVLGVMGIEENEYFYSSMVDFTTECIVEVATPTQLASSCYIIAQVLDPSFLKDKAKLGPSHP